MKKGEGLFSAFTDYQNMRAVLPTHRKSVKNTKTSMLTRLHSFSIPPSFMEVM